MTTRKYTPADRLVANVDQVIRTLFGRPSTTGREHPAHDVDESEMDEQERTTAARLMRINHTGEVCAQALYQGQALTARLEEVREDMQTAADEENDHLAWCEDRIRELGSHTSVLNPLFYAGSFAVGAIAGIAGDKWSLGFVAETEDQVVNHLNGHLKRLPDQDTRSRAILRQMRIDEGRHATKARAAGGVRLPYPIRVAMKGTARVMTSTTYWV